MMLSRHVAARLVSQWKMTPPRGALPFRQAQGPEPAEGHSFLDLFVDGFEPLRGQPNPFGHRLARQPDLVARPVDGLLPVKG